MEQAKFYGDIAEGPATGSAFWAQTVDKVRIRVGVYRPETESKGTVLLMLGRFGYVERYGRVAKDFANYGFTTVIVDWRSQGLADRMASDPKAGHVGSFSDYQNDVAAMMEVVEDLDLPQPFFLVGISMGACIGLRAMFDGLPVAAAAFISPMWGIKMSAPQRIAAWPLSWAAHRFGFGEKYVPGESSSIYVLETKFEDNNLTHNEAMYRYWVDQARRAPELQIGGPTMSWLFGALTECRQLSKIPCPNVPCITFCGELDQLVDNASIRARMAQWPDAEFSMIRNAKHDVLTEHPDVGGDVMSRVTTFFSDACEKIKAQ